MASPMTKTSAWSAIVAGLVRKKKARVMWKKESEVRIVFADMSAMMAANSLSIRLVGSCLSLTASSLRYPSDASNVEQLRYVARGSFVVPGSFFQPGLQLPQRNFHFTCVIGRVSSLAPR